MRELLTVILLVVSVKFLFLSDSASHIKIGLIWLAVDALLWWPNLKKLVA